MGPNLKNDLFKTVNLFLDKQLNNEAEKELLHEVTQNPAAQRLLSNEQDFRTLIKNNIERKTASPELIETIKLKIRKSPA
jgi:hypothetical protein